MNKNIHWYELCFFGDEDTESEKYDANKACGYVIKTEIPSVIDDKIALKILFGEPREQWEKELAENLPYLESRQIKKIVIDFSKEQDKL